MTKDRSLRAPMRGPVSPAIDQMLQEGVAFHQRGQLSEAKARYESILKQRPDHFDALHLLGVIAWQTKDFPKAEQLIGKAININPDNAAAHSNLGNVLHGLMRLDEALGSYDRAITLNPLHVEAYNNRGIVLKDLKRLNEALASYDRAIELRPNYPEARANRDAALELFAAFAGSGFFPRVRVFPGRRRSRIFRRCCGAD